MTRLVHFTATPLDEPLRSVHPYPKLKNGQREHLPIGKPRGLWVSVEGHGDGWSDWCKAEEFGQERFEYAYEVELAKDARILRLRTAADIQRFTKEYRDTESEVNKILGQSTFRDVPGTMDINWTKIAVKYQGIIIAPYVWELRLEPGYEWYYGWDCASGCVWNAEAIKSLKLIKQKVTV